MRTRLLAAVGMTALALPPALLITSSAASATTPTTPTSLLVSKPGSGCGPSPYHTIKAAIAAAPANATIVVCKGSYNEDAVVQQPVILAGLPGAVINPTKPVLQTNSPVYADAGNNGITVLSPNVTISGFEVTGATGDGILTAGDNETIKDTTSVNNGGIGIDLAGSSWSTVTGSTANANEGGGIQLTNDAAAVFSGATSAHDVISGNTANNNVAGCGVIVVDHVPGTSGIHDNRIADNVLKNNGTVNGGFGGGAGVVLASENAGAAVYNNIVIGNTIGSSGLAGVTIHSHAAGQNFSGNVITLNHIGPNNTLGDFADPFKTGVYVGSVDPVTVSVVGNTIKDNHYGIFTAGPVTLVKAGNNYVADKFFLGSVPTYAG